MSPLLKPACGPHSPATQTRPHQADAPPACGLRPTGRAVFLALLALAALVLTATGMKSGATDCGWRDLAAALWDSTGDADLRYFVLYLRLPRVAAALTVGASLAVTGVVLQNVLNNPLASSFTLGLSQGAAFGASFVMIALATAGGLAGLSLVALGALAGALAAGLCVLACSLVPSMTAQGLILAGVALSSFFGAATMSLQYFASDSQVAATVFWTFGHLSKGGWREAAVVAVTFAGGLAFALGRSLDFDVLRWGDAQATALGVNVRRLRFAALFTAALMAAVATAFYGVIGFVGLVAPHAVRLLFPHAGHAYLLCAAALLGGVFLLAADLVAQSLLYPVLLPIGIICAFTGTPVFLFLLFRGAARHAGRV